jgi:diadenosine tetraphosphatase ApaH/serine/threonine PP2A family protein phosphatase
MSFPARLALLSDIHANARALEACLADARVQGADKFAFLGDLVGYGAEPTQVLDTIMGMAKEGAWVIRGNHDALAFEPPVTSTTVGESTASWTHDQLNEAQRKFIARLPLVLRHHDVLLVHASAHEPERWHYVNSEQTAALSLNAAIAEPLGDPDVRYVFGGHVHHQTLYFRGTGRNLMAFNPTPGISIPVSSARSWIATVGSVGQPRDGQTAAMYALFDARQSRLTFRRVAYDHDAAARAIRDAGLPEFFAARLEKGR